MINNKRAQMQMGETIMVLLVFFIIVTVALVFYGTFQAGQMKQSIKDTTERDAVKVALKVSFLPEVACSENNVVEDNCFDIKKVAAFEEKIAESEQMFLFYVNELKVSNVTIEQIFPVPSNEERFVLYKGIPDDEERSENYEIIPTYIPITIKDPTRRVGKEYAFGMMTVEVYKPAKGE